MIFEALAVWLLLGVVYDIWDNYKFVHEAFKPNETQALLFLLHRLDVKSARRTPELERLYDRWIRSVGADHGEVAESMGSEQRVLRTSG